jgi:hypothetical protein
MRILSASMTAGLLIAGCAGGSQYTTNEGTTPQAGMTSETNVAPGTAQAPAASAERCPCPPGYHAQLIPGEREPVAGRDLGTVARRFADEVKGLPSREPTHPKEIAALRTLGDAVRLLPNTDPSLSAKIRANADTLERSGKKPLHSPEIRDALSAGLDAIARSDARKVTGLDEHVSAARDAVNQIDPTVPYLQQRDAGTHAFQRVSETLSFAADHLAMERQNVSGTDQTRPMNDPDQNEQQ